jgi:hypothetical protein
MLQAIELIAFIWPVFFRHRSGQAMIGTALASERLIGDSIGLPGSPFFAFMAVALYGIMTNVGFTGGWILELLSRLVWWAGWTRLAKWPSRGARYFR